MNIGVRYGIRDLRCFRGIDGIEVNLNDVGEGLTFDF